MQANSCCYEIFRGVYVCNVYERFCYCNSCAWHLLFSFLILLLTLVLIISNHLLFFLFLLLLFQYCQNLLHMLLLTSAFIGASRKSVYILLLWLQKKLLINRHHCQKYFKLNTIFNSLSTADYNFSKNFELIILYQLKFWKEILKLFTFS